MKKVPSEILELGSAYKVAYRKSTPIEEAQDYPGFKPHTQTLKKGTIHRDQGMPLPVDIIGEHDVPVQLRDGVTIYADIFRPVDAQDCPVIIAWSPYGKKGSWIHNDIFDNRVDVLPQWEDGLNKFEGPVPAYWCKHGYVIINVDGRGVFNSEGNIPFFGQQEAEDEYDVIEWAAAQPWSNGKVGTCGNSWFTMSQWNVCRLNPPHLKAIAPWEGARDLYRDAMFRGGIGDKVFFEGLLIHLFGKGYTEDIIGMVDAAPLFDDYWKTKVPDVAKSKIPAYVVGSWTNVLHTGGTFSSWHDYGCEEKWLRVHNRHEWVDFFNPEYVEDLRRFFDHYLKGVDNGWESTPRVRLTVLDPGHDDILERAESSFPLKRQQFESIYLDAKSGGFSRIAPTETSCVEYQPDEQGTVFQYKLQNDLEIAGYIKLKLWVEARQHDDMDVFAYITKLDKDGKEVFTEPVKGRYFTGPNGRLRASLRALDKEKSTDSQPYHRFDKVEKLSAGEIVPLEIDFWPYAMKWHEGETLQLRINGCDLLRRPEFPELPYIETINEGPHVIHTGGGYDSHLLIPVTSGKVNAS